jgi:hypothetical protein
MGLRNYVGRDHFTDSLSCSSAGVNSASDRSDVSAHDRRHQAGVDLFPANETNVRRFHHRIGSFDHRHQSTAFNHS